MSHDAAMRILGLNDAKSKNNKGVLVSKRLEDHTEEDILQAFQKESASHSKQLIQHFHNQYIDERMLLSNILTFRYCTFSARQGENQKMQDCHEAYQVQLTNQGAEQVVTKVLSGADQGAPRQKEFHQESRAEERGERGKCEGCRKRAHCRCGFQRENLWHKIKYSLGQACEVKEFSCSAHSSLISLLTLTYLASQNPTLYFHLLARLSDTLSNDRNRRRRGWVGTWQLLLGIDKV